jgi:hypothetical protein
MIVVEAVWGLIPSSFWTQGIWGNLLCGGWFHYCGTCSTEACRSTDLSRDHDLGLVRPLADDTGLTLGGKCSSFFLVSGGGGGILIPVLRWPTSIRVDTIHLFGVASLVVVRWAQSFIMLGPFWLLLELAEVQNL